MFGDFFFFFLSGFHFLFIYLFWSEQQAAENAGSVALCPEGKKKHLKTLFTQHWPHLHKDASAILSKNKIKTKTSKSIFEPFFTVPLFV